MLLIIVRILLIVCTFVSYKHLMFNLFYNPNILINTFALWELQHLYQPKKKWLSKISCQSINFVLIKSFCLRHIKKYIIQTYRTYISDGANNILDVDLKYCRNLVPSFMRRIYMSIFFLNIKDLWRSFYSIL